MKTVSYTQKVLNVWAVILILWSIYRAKLALPEWFDEFIAKPLIFILPVYLFIRKVEKGNFFSKIPLVAPCHGLPYQTKKVYREATQVSRR